MGLCPKEVAERLGVHEETVRRHLQRGWLKGTKLGPRLWTISEEDLAAYRRGQTHESPRRVGENPN